MSSIVLSGANATLRLGNTTKVTGWSDQSIIKVQDQSPSTQWREAYSSGNVIAQAGGTVMPPKHLILSNSDAVQWLSLTFGTSNALLALNRTTSNAIKLLDRSVRTNSNYFVKTFRTTSNAYAYGDCTNSNTIVWIKNNLISSNFGNNLDGTSLVVYQPYHHVFHGVGSARGFVRLNAGFTVLPNASVLMDTLETVSGGFDLRETGTLILNNDLYLSGNVTLTSGGNIKGKSSVTGAGNTIFLDGDLTLASATVNRCLHITGDWTNSGTSGDTIIDGQGHCLWIGDRAQIFVDTNVTLTLKNMVIHTSPKSVGSVPPIQLAAHGSTLALDNVVMDLGGDFNFKQGQLFIHDDVLVTGTSAFVYQSPRPSFITSGATWMFDQGTTFSFAPSAFTDGPYTQDYKSTSTTNNFLIMADPSSVLALNGCTLKTTYTGLRLRMGTVLMDNRVQIDTMAGVDVPSGTPTSAVAFSGSAVTGLADGSVSWSPDGRFLVVANSGSNNIQIYSFSGNGAPVSLGTVAAGVNPSYVAWSPDGRFVAITNGFNGAGGNSLQIYSFMTSGLPVSIGSVATGTRPSFVAWSPDGRFVALTLYGGSYGLQVFRFTGSGVPYLLGTAPTGTTPWAVRWSPDGRFLAVANYGAPYAIQFYRFSGSGVPESLGTVGSGSQPSYITWSPDGRFVAMTNRTSNNFQVYRIRAAGLPVSLGTVATGSVPRGITWSPNGQFIAVANEQGRTLQIYRCRWPALPLSLGTVLCDAYPCDCPWSPDGRFIALVCSDAATLLIFRVNFIKVAESQAMTSSLIFGDSANGSAFDVNTQVLSGAWVDIKGMVSDDSA